MSKYERKTRLTVPFFSLSREPLMHVRIVGPIERITAEHLSKSDDGGVDIVPVINLETGEFGNLLLLTVVKSALERTGDDYVGRCYELDNKGAQEGRGYAAVDVYEIDYLPDEPTDLEG